MGSELVWRKSLQELHRMSSPQLAARTADARSRLVNDRQRWIDKFRALCPCYNRRKGVSSGTKRRAPWRSGVRTRGRRAPL